MPTVGANGIELYYEERGDVDGVPLVAISGLGSSIRMWDDAWLDAFVDRGFRVFTFDNREMGRSTSTSHPDLDLMGSVVAAMGGDPGGAPYTLSAMAADVAGLLDALEVADAHVVGVSMGGMIAQTFAIEHPDRVRTLTSIMSTTGEREVGTPAPDAAAVLLRPAAHDEASFVDNHVATWRVIGTPEAFDEEALRERAQRLWAWGVNPIGAGKQLLAILASPSREAGLAALEVPTLVVHGDADPLVNVSGGRRTAELVADSTLLEIEGMAHDIPSFHRAAVVDAITTHVQTMEVANQ